MVAHRDGEFHFKADWSTLGPSTPDERVARLLCDRPTNAERPFHLVAAPARSFLNTSFTETPGSQTRPTDRTSIQPIVAMGGVDGDVLRIGNDRGSLRVHGRQHGAARCGDRRRRMAKCIHRRRGRMSSPAPRRAAERRRRVTAVWINMSRRQMRRSTCDRAARRLGSVSEGYCRRAGPRSCRSRRSDPSQ